MLQTRRQLADRGRALAERARDSSPLLTIRTRSLRSYPRQPLSERVAEQLALRRPQLPDPDEIKGRFHRLRESIQNARHLVANPKWLVRLGCSAAALLLLFALIFYSGVTSSPPSSLATSSNGAGSGTAAGSSAGKAQAPSLAQASTAGGAATLASHPKPKKAKVAHHTSVASHPSHVTHASGASAAATAATHHTHTAKAHTTPSHTSTPTTSTNTTPTTTSSNPTSTSKSLAPTTTVTSSTPSPSASATPSGGVMSAASFEALHLNQARLSRLGARFGSTATPSQLSSVFGPHWVQALLPHQVEGDTCVYYLPSATGASTVYQLCFGGTGRLAEKTVIAG